MPRSDFGPILCSLVLVVLLSGLALEPAKATILTPDVYIHGEALTTSLRPGQAFELSLTIYIKDGIALERIEASPNVRGSDIALISNEAAAKSASAPNGYSALHRKITGTFTAKLDILWITVDAGGESYEEEVHLREIAPPTPQPLQSNMALKAPRIVRVHGNLGMTVSTGSFIRGVDNAKVSLMKRETFDDTTLATSYTDSIGNFDFNASVDGTPTVYVKFESKNPFVNVGHELFFTTYSSSSFVYENFAGSDINLPASFFRGQMNEALWILTTITRAHRWYVGQGFNLPQVNVRSPDDVLLSSAYLEAPMEGIHFRSANMWSSDTLVHEYGHHFVHHEAEQVSPPFYTNGNCDPGHCRFCSENEAVAWSEGFPYFLASIINAEHTATYGWSQPGQWSFENLANCRETDALDTNPPSTEGMLAAFLNDLIDSNSDTSALGPGITEYSQIPIADIFHVATVIRPSDSLALLSDMRDYVASVHGAAELQELWAAAIINGLASDTVLPLPPTSITSTTHTPSVLSESNMPALFFSGASDEDSGVAGYYITMTPTASYPASGGIESPSASFRWPTPLAEGTWWANVASLDRAGNKSAGHLSFGPMLVGPPGALDFQVVTPEFWEGPLVIRTSADATPSVAGMATDIPADTDLWFNFSAQNVSASGGFVPFSRTWIFDNGSNLLAQDVDSTVVAAFEMLQMVNRGPVQLTGGSHRIYAEVDRSGSVAESIETNNGHGYRLVVRPTVLLPGPWVTKPAGPHADVGNDDVFTTVPNSAGVRVAPANKFAAVMSRTHTEVNAYRLRLHAPSTGPFDGFETVLASDRDVSTNHNAIVFNQGALPHSSFDIGILRTSYSPSLGYDIRHISSELLLPGDGMIVNWGSEDHLALFEFFFNVIELGPFSMTIDADFAVEEEAPELHLFWIDKLTGATGLSATVPSARTNDLGEATLDVNVPASGDYCLAVRREADFGLTHLPVTITLTTSSSVPPELEVIRDNAFWDAPFLPSLQPVPGPKLQIPLDLAGGLSTYFNFGIANTGLVTSGSAFVAVAIDGNQTLQFTPLGPLQGQSSVDFYGTDPVTIEGGRHTLTLLIDPLNQIFERDETNNLHATQFGWSGPALGFGASLQSDAPPDAGAGLDLIEIVEVENSIDGDGPSMLPLTFIAPNSDGFRLPQPAPKQGQLGWSGVATMPGAGSNVDLRLHEVMPSATAFTLELAVSDWDMGESDFVLVDFNETASRDFDVSVINAGGSEPYTLQATQSLHLGTLALPFETYGPFQMAINEVFQLFEFDIPAGSYTVSLETAGIADLGLSLHRPRLGFREPYHSKSEAFIDAPAAWLEPAGVSESIQFTVEWGEGGNHCIAVWKKAASDLPLDEFFELKFTNVPVYQPYIVIDGTADANYGPPIAVQSLQTEFGDSNLGQVDGANGSELDQVYAKFFDGTLYMLFAGNLESNLNDLEIFLDTRRDGQNRLRGDNADIAGGALMRMGDDGSGNGLTFDPAFTADYYFTVNGDFPGAYTGSALPYQLSAHDAELLTEGGGTGRFLGATLAGSTGRLVGPDPSSLPPGFKIAVDNSNTAGVTAGTGVDSGAGVLTGIEFAIPATEIGDPSQCIKIVAFVNGREHDYVSNQMLGPLPLGTSNLAEPRDVDLGDHAGEQYFWVCPEGAVNVEDDLPTKPAKSFHLHAASPNPFNPRTRIRFDLPVASPVVVEIFDLAGRRVRTLLAVDDMPAGSHDLLWEARDHGGRIVASGTYLVRMRAGSFSETRRVTLLK